MEEIRAKLHQLLEEKRRGIIVTIIDVEGSAYLREGARCLITEEGELIGFVSGGCVEGDIQEHAKQVFETGAPQKLLYDFRWESDEIWGMGVGCNGSITVWLELFDPLNHKEHALAIFDEWECRRSCDSSYLISTVIETKDEQAIPVGHRLILEQSQVKPPCNKEAGLVQQQIDGVEVTLFVERIHPRQRLSIIGSGPDAVLLCNAAKALEWRVRIIDHREGYANPTFFPQADEIMVIPRANFSTVTTRNDEYFVVMTHNLDIDMEAIKFLVPRELSYIGILGSRQRNEMIFKQLQLLQPNYPMEWGKKVYAPIGLDIGAKSPKEIILSIMAELVAHRNHKSGGSLSLLDKFSLV